MPSRVSAFVIWAVVALSATFWAMRLLVRAPAAPPNAVPAGETVVARGDVSRLFGAAATAAPSTPVAASPAVPSRFRLVGVAAPKAGSSAGGGVALIAVDGKPARPYRVGAAVEGDLTLRAVDIRTASLGPRDGKETVLLEVPPRPVATTGSLPPAPALSAGPSAIAPATGAVVTPQQGAPAAVPATGAPPRLRPTIVPGSEGLATTPLEGASAVR